MSKVTTSSASAADTAELKERLLALEAMVTGLVTALSAPAAAAAAPAAPAPAPAPAAAPAAPAPAAPMLPTMTRNELARLTPQQKVQYMAACRAAYFGKSGGTTPGGVYGMVGGFAAKQAANARTAVTHTLDVYATERMQYLLSRGE